MDLFAYAQIDDLEQIAKENNIEVPRLRGYRLMKDEEPISSEKLKKLMKECEVAMCDILCCSHPFWNPYSCSGSDNEHINYLRKYYLVARKDENGYIEYTDIRWDRIHGWKRKILKFEIKKQKKRVKEQFDMWNKYVGRADVLYIHSRIGGDNWNYFKGNELMKQPWFLDKVDDCYDETYCDIYALIK